MYLAEKIEAGHLTLAHHDGGTAKRLAAWLARAKMLDSDPLAALVAPRQPGADASPSPRARCRPPSRPARASQQSERHVTIVSLALACGLRQDEMRSLRWPDDIDLGRAVLWIRQTKTEAGERCVPISPASSRSSTATLRTGDAHAPQGRCSQRPRRPFRYDGFAQIFRRIPRRLPAALDVKIHRTRNTALANWRRAGVDIATIAKLAGHADIAQTEHDLGDITLEEIAQDPDAFGRSTGSARGDAHGSPHHSFDFGLARRENARCRRIFGGPLAQR